MITYLQVPKLSGEFRYNLLRKILGWRFLSVFLLGFCSNLLVNVILDLKYQRSVGSLGIGETINAIIVSAFLLKGVRWITKILETSFPWESGALKRLIVQLGLHFIFLVASLNLLVIVGTYIVYGGFYTLEDLLVINISVISLVFFFSIIDNGIFFFIRWRRLESKSGNVDKVNAEKPLKIVSGRSSYLINQEEILYAKYHAGLVMIATRNQQKFRYGKSLDNLMSVLNRKRFFRANRQLILNRSVVNRLTPMDYGKLMVELRTDEEKLLEVIVSRGKAAKFRKWINSSIND